MLTAAGRRPEPCIGLSAGEVAGAFSAVTTDGEAVTGAAGLRVVAFFSSWCSVCPERVPPFVDYLSSTVSARDSVLAVVVGPGERRRRPTWTGSPRWPRSASSRQDGEIARAFKVTGFPAFFLLDADGAVAASGYDPAALPEPATV